MNAILKTSIASAALAVLWLAPPALAEVLPYASPPDVVAGATFYVGFENPPRGRVFLGLASLFGPTSELQIPPRAKLREAAARPSLDQGHDVDGYRFAFTVPDVPPGRYYVVLSGWATGYNGLAWGGDIPSELDVAALPPTSTDAGFVEPGSVPSGHNDVGWLLVAGAAGAVLFRLRQHATFLATSRRHASRSPGADAVPAGADPSA